MGGQGLLDRWYDACMNWSPTVGRTHVFSFSQSYRKLIPAQFYIKFDDTMFDPTNITGKKIGFLDGYSSDEKCLVRQSDKIIGAYVQPDNVLHVNGPGELIDKIVRGEVAAGFSGEENMKQAITEKKVKKSGGDILCKLGGNAVMARKDSPFLGKQ
ncbi:unnamed protein product [Owenia fusiformis]|uniref:Uncharacterized protein n=1 Tax=Owenia fusiformis TaxID=6347 RepID=A0A8J1TIM9_OWEFU|nr:unnamed protein product [Owenia fusiformis]